jgi:hypothetical protein
MRNSNLRNQRNQGISSLLIVFIIASILALYLFGTQLMSVSDARRINQVQYSQIAFFAAEGALYETIQHLRNDTGWLIDLKEGDPPDEHEYPIGEAEIKRIISRDADGKLSIDITATVKNNKRRLVASFRAGEGSETEKDIHTSGSCMGQEVNVSMTDIKYVKNGTPSFTVEPNQSWVHKKKNPDGKWVFITECNLTSTPKNIIPPGSTSSRRMWKCAGICPNFEMFLPSKIIPQYIEPGKTAQIGNIAILDDDIDNRINCILLNPPDTLIESDPPESLCERNRNKALSEGKEAKILVSCDQGEDLVAESCGYVLDEGGEIAAIHEDSNGVDRQLHITDAAGEIIWLAEEKPGPEATPTP